MEPGVRPPGDRETAQSGVVVVVVVVAERGCWGYWVGCLASGLGVELGCPAFEDGVELVFALCSGAGELRPLPC